MWKNKLWETLVISTAFIEILVFRNRLSHSKVTVTKVEVSDFRAEQTAQSDFRAEQTAHWSTHRLVVSVACLRTVKKVANPHSISLKDTQNRIIRKFRHFNIRNQNVIFIMSNCTVLGTQIKQYACNLHLNKQRDNKIVSDIFHRGSKNYEMI